MSKKIRWYDYITVNSYWLGLTTLSQTLGLVFPLLVQQYVGEGGKGTFFGTLRLWSLMVALLSQAGMGMLSDHCRSRWGRRRPFILIGTLIDLIFITMIGFSAGMEGMSGYWFLFIVAILLQISSNTAHGALQGLIPDIVPEEKRGRFSGVKALLEVPLPLIMVSFLIAPLISKGNMWGGLLLAMGVLVVVMLLAMFVPEKPLEERLSELNWDPFLRLLGMTGLFTVIILGVGRVIKYVGFISQDITSVTGLILLLGLSGIVAIAITVAIGVWSSVRISLGADSQKYPSFTWWVVNRLAFFVGTTNLSTFAVYFLQGRLGYVREEAAAPAARLMMVVGVFILLSTLPSGWLADRFGSKRLAAVSGLLAALGTLVAILVPDMVVIYIGGCMIGLATGVFFTANWALGTEIVPKEEAGRYLGISNLAGAGAGAVGSYIGGPIADFFTVHVPEVPGLGYVMLFGIYGVLFLLSAVALVGVKRKAG
ncbi:MAG: MFS transporter [Chloroflexota bacterium]